MYDFYPEDWQGQNNNSQDSSMQSETQSSQPEARFLRRQRLMSPDAQAAVVAQSVERQQS